MGVSDCAGVQPNWDASFYKIRPERESIIREEHGTILDEITFFLEDEHGEYILNEDGERIVNPEIMLFVSTLNSNLKKLQDEVLNACEKWSRVPQFDNLL